MIKITVKNAQELAVLFAQAPKITKKWSTKALHASNAEMWKKNVKGVTPWDTGTMSQTFEDEVVGFDAIFAPTRKYSEHVYFGTKFQKPQKFLDEIARLSESPIKNHFITAINAISKEVTNVK